MIRAALVAALVALSGAALAADESCFVNVASDELGWLSFSGGKVTGGKGGSANARFRAGTAPDGKRAIEHTITKGKTIPPLGADSPILYNGQTKAIRLSYSMWTEAGKGRGWDGKYMAIMLGRGQAGGHYENGPRRSPSSNPEGASYYLLAPVTTGAMGTASGRNGLRGAIGSANRGALGASCEPLKSSRAGGDPSGGNRQRCFEKLHGTSPTLPTGRWVDVTMTIVMNDTGRANGSASYTYDGRGYSTGPVVEWLLNPSKSTDVFMRHRMMFGGTYEVRPAPMSIREWFRNFRLDVIPAGSGEGCAPAELVEAPVASITEESPALPASPVDMDVEYDKECAIWLCIGQFGHPACAAAVAAKLRRTLRGDSPIPSFGSCDSGGENHGFDVTYGIAARIGDDEPARYRMGLSCEMKSNSSSVVSGTLSPRGCTGTYGWVQVWQWGRRAFPLDFTRMRGAPSSPTL